MGFCIVKSYLKKEKHDFLTFDKFAPEKVGFFRENIKGSSFIDIRNKY